VTRLMAEEVRLIPRELPDYDAGLLRKTGLNLGQLAARATGLACERYQPRERQVAVIPFTTGLGIIGGFSEAVCAIAGHLGFRARVTETTDAAGLAEAYRDRADVVIMADDNIYVAINLAERSVVDNDEATARGYVTALKAMAGSLKDREVLLIGAGRVGQEAALALGEVGARIIIYDMDRKKEYKLAAWLEEQYGLSVLCDIALEEALGRNPLIFDASPGEAFIGEELVGENTIAAAPGLPLGFTPEALNKLGKRLIHDPLQIGTAVMLYKACFQDEM
jgi:3-methylornithyl-N6-L-lysine dehydrogenase